MSQRRRRRSGSSSIVVVSDTFNRADGDFFTLGVADTGQVWAPFGVSSRWTISGNQAAPFEAGTPATGHVVDAGVSSGTMQFTQKLVNSLSGQVFRQVNATNYWLWSYINLTQKTISKWIAGVETVLFTDTPGASAVDDVWSITIDAANLISLKRNGVLIRALTDAQHAAGTKFGFGGSVGTTDRFDNFSFTVP